MSTYDVPAGLEWPREDRPAPDWRPDPTPASAINRFSAVDPGTGLALTVVAYGPSWMVNVAGQLDGTAIVSVDPGRSKSADEAMVRAIDIADRLHASGVRSR
jgi:hypothetical protein